jgi:hypothetical protein
MNIKARATRLPDHFQMDWQPITTAPFGRSIELAVIDANEVHTLVFPCRRAPSGWVNADSNAPVNVHPTHWREWGVPITRLSRFPS